VEELSFSQSLPPLVFPLKIHFANLDGLGVPMRTLLLPPQFHSHPGRLRSAPSPPQLRLCPKRTRPNPLLPPLSPHRIYTHTRLTTILRTALPRCPRLRKSTCSLLLLALLRALPTQPPSAADLDAARRASTRANDLTSRKQ
jgi:hypothetical protein